MFIYKITEFNIKYLIAGLFFGITGTFLLLAIFDYGFDSPNNSIFLNIFFSCFSFLVSGISFYLLLTNRTFCLFSKDEIVKRNDFGVKTTIPRKMITGVFISTIYSHTNGALDGTSYWIEVKTPKLKNDSQRILFLEEKSSSNTILGAMKTGNNSTAYEDAIRLVNLISEHWNLSTNKSST